MGSPLVFEAKVFLENLTFKQQFVIADGITAEAILGMDFLEANKCVFDIFYVKGNW